MPKLSTTLRNSISDATALTATYCELYTGTIPATGATSPTGTLLVSWAGTVAWNAAASGAATLSGAPITSDTAAATGTAGYARFWDGSATGFYATVGTSGAEVNLSSLSVTSGGTLNMTSASITTPAS